MRSVKFVTSDWSRFRRSPYLVGGLVMADGAVPFIFAQIHGTHPPALAPDNLEREARRQERIAGSRVLQLIAADRQRYRHVP